MAKLESLVDDIYSLFDPAIDHKVEEANLDNLCENIKTLIRSRLAADTRDSSPALRFSSLGKPDRQLWFDTHPAEGSKEQMLPKTYLKFMYGAIIEELLLFLVKESGHSVTDEQKEIEVDGVKGHIDAIIDGVVVDVKSASPYGYKKFKEQRVTEDDPFGYTQQLAGYAAVLTPGQDAAWLAMDKSAGDICVSPLSKTVIKHYLPEERITHLKEVVAKDEPPGYCYETVPDGKSGNMKLQTGCSYCAHKFRCRPGLRTFIYSTGPRFLDVVAVVPNVPEITDVVSVDALQE